MVECWHFSILVGLLKNIQEQHRSNTPQSEKRSMAVAFLSISVLAWCEYLAHGGAQPKGQAHEIFFTVFRANQTISTVQAASAVLQHIDLLKS